MRRGVVKVVGGSAVGQLILLASVPVLARIFTPGDFGALAVLVALAGTLSVPASLRFEAAIPIAEDARTAAELAWSAIICAGFVSLVLGGLLTARPGLSTSLLDGAQVPYFGVVTGVTIMMLSLNNVFSRWMIRQQRYGALGLRNALQAGVQVAVQVVLGLVTTGASALLVGVPASRLAGAGGLLGPAGLLRAPRPSAASWRATVVRFKKFPLVASWSSLLSSAGLHLPVLLIAAHYGAVVVGLLAVAQRLVSAPINLISANVETVFQGAAAASIRSGSPTLVPLVRRTSGSLALAAVVPAVIAVALSQQVVVALLGDEWAGAGQFAQVLVITAFLQSSVVPVASVLTALEWQGTRAVWDGARAVATTGVVLGCVWADAPVLGTVMALSITQCVAYICLYLLVERAAGAAGAGTVPDPPRAEA